MGTHVNMVFGTRRPSSGRSSSERRRFRPCIMRDCGTAKYFSIGGLRCFESARNGGREGGGGYCSDGVEMEFDGLVGFECTSASMDIAVPPLFLRSRWWTNQAAFLYYVNGVRRHL